MINDFRSLTSRYLKHIHRGPFNRKALYDCADEALYSSAEVHMTRR